MLKSSMDYPLDKHEKIWPWTFQVYDIDTDSGRIDEHVLIIVKIFWERNWWFVREVLVQHNLQVPEFTGVLNDSTMQSRNSRWVPKRVIQKKLLLQKIQQLWLSMLRFRRTNDNQKSYSTSRHHATMQPCNQPCRRLIFRAQGGQFCTRALRNNGRKGEWYKDGCNQVELN